jgi:hypothetical protein
VQRKEDRVGAAVLGVALVGTVVGTVLTWRALPLVATFLLVCSVALLVALTRLLRVGQK